MAINQQCDPPIRAAQVSVEGSGGGVILVTVDGFVVHVLVVLALLAVVAGAGVAAVVLGVAVAVTRRLVGLVCNHVDIVQAVCHPLRPDNTPTMPLR